MQKFSLYCGAFAATRLFVEMAIPTALILSADNIKLGKDIKLEPGAMWTPDELKNLKPYNLQLDRLLNNFPLRKLYLHPIKLSQWK